MTKTYRIVCLSEAVSPITHMARTAGNEAIVAREPVVSPRGIVWVPFLSGNALRHRLIREPGARWLVDRLGLRGKLSLTQLNFLFHGGNLTEGGGRENTRRIADMQRLFPLLRLVGGSLPDQILSGSLLVSRGTLVCEENRTTLASMLPEDMELPSGLRSAEDFVSGYQYTRGDAAKTARDMLPEESGERDSNLMIFAGQAITRNACFLHLFTLQHVSRLELGALLLSLQLWQEAGGTIGGQAARGHGRLQTFVHGIDQDAVDEYVAHVDSCRDEAAAWLNDGFAPPAKKKKGKEVAADEVVA